MRNVIFLAVFAAPDPHRGGGDGEGGKRLHTLPLSQSRDQYRAQFADDTADDVRKQKTGSRFDTSAGLARARGGFLAMGFASLIDLEQSLKPILTVEQCRDDSSIPSGINLGLNAENLLPFFFFF